ncbi:MAG: ribonuclease R [Patescibacteria group bacterium]
MKSSTTPADLYRGTVSVSSKGVGYLSVEGAPEDADDIEIQPDRLHTAMHGDEVEVKSAAKDPRSPRPQGEVTKIVQRAKTRFVGVVEIEKGKHFLIPDDRRMYRDFEIVEGKSGTKNVALKDLAADMKVMVEMTEWTEGKNPQAVALSVIGKKGNNDAEMYSIVLEKGFDTVFPKEVEAEADEIERTQKPIPPAEIAKRRDMCDTLTFTIDPHDAKDFDDAISFKKVAAQNGEELFEIGVHIADVSHYVRPGSALDKEATKRACSVYMVDRTIPMLPEVLSNDLCSLNAHEDKAAFSSIFVMNATGKVQERWFGRTVINSNHRYTYESAQTVIVGEKGPGDQYAKELTTLNGIAKKLNAQRFADGSIDFEKDEVKFELEPGTGKPLRVILKKRFDAHKLVEEFMLLANREVALFVHTIDSKKETKRPTLLYRIHDLPDPEKLADLAEFIKALGYELESHDGRITSKAIKKMLNSVTGTPHESLIRTATIRSMAKAIYSTQNIGHFGLAFKHYAHFTSPIRRYPDVLVHRVLQHYLDGHMIPEHEIATYERAAAKSSEREVIAAEAERSSIKYKQVEYMQDKVGQTFDGTITGVTEWGIYIEENTTKCEGMAKIRDLGDDFYSLDKKNYRLVGDKTKKMYTLGDIVKFKIIAADMERKALDYVIVK